MDVADEPPGSTAELDAADDVSAEADEGDGNAEDAAGDTLLALEDGTTCDAACDDANDDAVPPCADDDLAAAPELAGAWEDGSAVLP